MMRWLAALALALLAREARAQEWTPLDARSQALGGAGVAFAEGADASYWNPAALAAGGQHPLDFSTGFGFAFHVSTGYAFAGDIAGDVSHLIDLFDSIAFDTLQESLNAGTAPTDGDVQNLIRVVDGIASLDDPGKGLVSTSGLALQLRVGPFGLFARGTLALGGDPMADLSAIGALSSGGLNAFFQNINSSPALSPAGSALAAQLAACGLTSNSNGGSFTDAEELAYQAQLALGDAGISDPAFQQALCSSVAAMAAGAAPEDTLYNSETGIILRGVAQVELGVAFGLPVIPTVLEAGIALKEVITETVYRRVTIAERDQGDSGGEDLSDAVRDDLQDSRRRTTRFNLDLGARYSPWSWVSAAISARNIIPMRVDIAGPERSIELDPQVRAALLFSPFSSLRVGADLDLLETESPVLPDYRFRHFGAGVELDLWVFKLRAGYADNLATDESDGAVTGGLGLACLGVRLDLGVRYGLSGTEVVRSGEIDAEKLELPQQLSFGVTLGVEVKF